MRRAGIALIAAVLALAGCKNAGTKSEDDTKSPGGVASRTKKPNKDKDIAKAPVWLDDVGRLPGAGTSVPKGNTVTDPRDPNFDPKTAAQDVLAGRVLTPDGKPARNILVRIEQVGVIRSGPSDKAISSGVYTNNDGYFQAPGKPGKTYELTADATNQDGRKLVGVVQTKVPNPILLIVLRDDLSQPLPKGADGGTFPPEPKPSDKVGDYIPPMGVTPAAPPKPAGAGNDWKPGGAITGVPPASIGGNTPKPPPPVSPPAGPTPGGPTPGGVIPPPDDLSPPSNPKPIKPENVADAPKPFSSPPASIPGEPAGPAVPPLPKLPPSFPSPGGRSSMAPNAGNAGKLALIDTLGRPWSLDAVKPGSLVLVEFMSATCVHCPAVIPVLSDLQSRYGASGLQVAAVLCDDGSQVQRTAAATKYSRDYNLNYAMYVEPGAAGSLRDSLGVDSYPTALLVDSTGRVIWRGHPGNKAQLESAIKQNLGK